MVTPCLPRLKNTLTLVKEQNGVVDLGLPEYELEILVRLHDPQRGEIDQQHLWKYGVPNSANNLIVGGHHLVGMSLILGTRSECSHTGGEGGYKFELGGCKFELGEILCKSELRTQGALISGPMHH